MSASLRGLGTGGDLSMKLQKQGRSIEVENNKLSTLVDEEGGLNRRDASTDAAARVEALRDEAVRGIAAALDQLELLAHGASNKDLSADELTQVRMLSNRLINLAGTFGFVRLDQVARSLGDLTNVYGGSGQDASGPILVHVHAARLFVPGATSVDEKDSKRILAELKKVIHYCGRSART